MSTSQSLPDQIHLSRVFGRVPALLLLALLLALGSRSHQASFRRAADHPTNAQAARGLIRWYPAQEAQLQTGCQCTDFVYSQRPDLEPTMGQAKSWLWAARLQRLPYDQVPQVGDVAVFLNGAHGFSAEFGHVAMVTAVSEDRTRFSIEGWDGLIGDCSLEQYEDLTVSRDTYFIHRRARADSEAALQRLNLTPSPGSPARLGMPVAFSASLEPGVHVRGLRLLIDGQRVFETEARRFTYAWDTAACAAGSYSIEVQLLPDGLTASRSMIGGSLQFELYAGYRPPWLPQQPERFEDHSTALDGITCLQESDDDQAARWIAFLLPDIQP